MRIAICALIFALISFFGTTKIAAAECDGDTCIDVEANQESNEVIIIVKKGKAGSATTSRPRPATSATLRQPWIPWLPKPATTTKAHPKPATSIKPRVRKISGSQISDQVKSLLPSGSIVTQPLGDALVQEPVNFMTNTPTQFTTVLIVLNVPITIHLTPVFTWDFGDGKSITTKLPGAPYPISLINHTYLAAGEKRITLTTKWSGYWRAGALSAPIKGAITQRTSKSILVRPGAVNYKP